MAQSQEIFRNPSPILRSDGWLSLYYVKDGKLRRIYTADGHIFSSPTTMNVPGPVSASHGSVTYDKGIYYYVFSGNPSGAYLPPIALYVSRSTDGINFSKPSWINSGLGVPPSGSLYLWSPIFVPSLGSLFSRQQPRRYLIFGSKLQY